MCFFVGLGEEMTAESEVGCVENIINTVVFVRFHFFTCFCMISNRLLDVFLVAFGVPWGHFFSFMRALRAGLKCDDFLEIPWGSPG